MNHLWNQVGMLGWKGSIYLKSKYANSCCRFLLYGGPYMGDFTVLLQKVCAIENACPDLRLFIFWLGKCTAKSSPSGSRSNC